MPDFGSRWKITQKEPLGKGGQGQAFVVSEGLDETSTKYVAKVLGGANLSAQSARWKRLEEEIEISKSFDHPNVIRVIDSGHTVGSGYPFYVMPFHPDRSLEHHRSKLTSPLDVFQLFAELCDGVAHIHSKNVVHRDLKPANIFIDGCHPVVGDLGLAFRFDAESLTELMEVATARWFGAPELRNGHLEQPLPSADIYSLGKLLYWLFTGRVFDRDEQEYEVEDRSLSHILGQRAMNPGTGVIDDRLIHAGAFADDIVSETVRYQPSHRIQSAKELAAKIRRLIARFESGGRALDLRLPQRCLFCGTGGYRPVAMPPNAELRTAPYDHGAFGSNVWAEMQNQTRGSIGEAFSGRGGNTPVPLTLICDYCGNMQHFRWDRAPDAQKHWKP